MDESYEQIEDEEIPGEQRKNRGDNLKPWQFKPGQSGNPSGRPKGPSMKEWAKLYLARMNDKERLAFMKGLNKDTIWKMAEGNWAQDITSGGEPLIPKPILDVSRNNSDQKDSEIKQEN